jgi:hypothetical protein
MSCCYVLVSVCHCRPAVALLIKVDLKHIPADQAFQRSFSVADHSLHLIRRLVTSGLCPIVIVDTLETFYKQDAACFTPEISMRVPCRGTSMELSYRVLRLGAWG